MTVECLRCGEVFSDAEAFGAHDPGCVCRPLVASPEEWRWRTEPAKPRAADPAGPLEPKSD
jgi:predicted  nucleic acid-binding Zn-ribbon protein